MTFCLFTIPRAFEGVHAIRQDNAIGAWSRLQPRPAHIALFGDDPGVADAARKHDCWHIPQILRSEQGTPLVNAAFHDIQDHVKVDVYGYTNTDILFLSDLVPAVRKVAAAFKSFLLIGRRWMWDTAAPLDFTARWEQDLRGQLPAFPLYAPCGVDYFIFSAGLYQDMPPFIVGRCAWDNWLVGSILDAGIPVIDATAAITCIHQGLALRFPPTAEYLHNQALYHDAKLQHRGWIDEAPFILDEYGKIGKR